ncbi:TPA: autotransporter domain-containing protein [Morganella morganii]|nr:autotransporter domain-containing protein [Morganella morganii]
MMSLGTLRQDNSGNSYGRVMSADGKVIAGAADTDNHSRQAYRLSENDTKMISLGTLRSDNSGDSDALAISPDGRVVAGKAETDNGDEQAFVYRSGDQKMTGLGTLRSDGTGRSEANRVSADGEVIAGISQSDTEFRRAVLWVRDKVTEEEVIIDEGKTGNAIAETGKTAFSVLDLYQSALYSLSESRCQIGDSNYCVGAFSQFDNVRSNHRVATGIFGAFRFPAENWVAGASLNFANNTRLTDGYDTRGSNNPGVGAYIRYQENKDNTGSGAELSGAFLNQDVTITRNHLKNTEAGRGDSSIKAYRFKAAVNYGVNLSETTQLIPNAAISHHNVTRDGYTENSNTNLAATYGRMGNKSTDLRTGLDIRQALTPDIDLYGGAGIDINLNNQRDAFISRVNYIGTYTFDNGNSRNVKPYAYAEVNINMTANSAIGINIGWHQTDYTNDAAQAGLNYSYRW